MHGRMPYATFEDAGNSLRFQHQLSDFLNDGPAKTGVDFQGDY